MLHQGLHSNMAGLSSQWEAAAVANEMQRTHQELRVFLDELVEVERFDAQNGIQIHCSVRAVDDVNRPVDCLHGQLI
jgi:hypothetical protein